MLLFNGRSFYIGMVVVAVYRIYLGDTVYKPSGFPWPLPSTIRFYLSAWHPGVTENSTWYSKYFLTDWESPEWFKRETGIWLISLIVLVPLFWSTMPWTKCRQEARVQTWLEYASLLTGGGFALIAILVLAHSSLFARSEQRLLYDRLIDTFVLVSDVSKDRELSLVWETIILVIMLLLWRGRLTIWLFAHALPQSEQNRANIRKLRFVCALLFPVTLLFANVASNGWTRHSSITTRLLVVFVLSISFLYGIISTKRHILHVRADNGDCSICRWMRQEILHRGVYHPVDAWGETMIPILLDLYALDNLLNVANMIRGLSPYLALRFCEGREGTGMCAEILSLLKLQSFGCSLSSWFFFTAIVRLLNTCAFENQLTVRLLLMPIYILFTSLYLLVNLLESQTFVARRFYSLHLLATILLAGASVLATAALGACFTIVKRVLSRSTSEVSS